MVVGDGVNDALAFAAGACGISVTGAHAAARQTADVAIEQGGIERLPALIDLSRMASRITAQNLLLSVGYNAFLIPAAISGSIGPGIAAFAMAASSASVCAMLCGCVDWRHADVTTAEFLPEHRNRLFAETTDVRQAWK